MRRPAKSQLPASSIVYDAIKNQTLRKSLGVDFTDTLLALAAEPMSDLVAYGTYAVERLMTINLNKLAYLIHWRYLSPELILLEAMVPLAADLGLDATAQAMVDYLATNPPVVDELATEVRLIRQAAQHSLASLEKMILPIQLGDLLQLKQLAKQRGVKHQVLINTVLQQFIQAQEILSC